MPVYLQITIGSSRALKRRYPLLLAVPIMALQITIGSSRALKRPWSATSSPFENTFKSPSARREH
jgi:hypothetical protein